VNGISAGQWQILLVVVALLTFGLGALVMWLRTPSRADLDDAYEEGRRDALEARAETAVLPEREDRLPGQGGGDRGSGGDRVEGHSEDALVSLPDMPEMASDDDGGNVSGGDFLHPDFGQLDPAALDAANTDLPGPAQTTAMSPGQATSSGSRAGGLQTEAERQFAFDWDVTMWQLEMQADIARVDRELAVTA